MGNGLFEKAENGMPGGRGKEDHFEDHQVWIEPPVCEG